MSPATPDVTNSIELTKTKVKKDVSSIQPAPKSQLKR
jgi:hypothetical protein